jgi:hypothetical protein
MIIDIVSLYIVCPGQNTTNVHFGAKDQLFVRLTCKQVHFIVRLYNGVTHVRPGASISISVQRFATHLATFDYTCLRLHSLDDVCLRLDILAKAPITQ